MTAIGLSRVAWDISRRLKMVGTFSALWMQTRIFSSEFGLECWIVFLLNGWNYLEGSQRYLINGVIIAVVNTSDNTHTLNSSPSKI